MDDLWDFGDQNNTLNFDSLFDCNFYPQVRPQSPLKRDELPTTSSNVAEENPLDASEIDQGLNDAAQGTSFDFMDDLLLDEKARKYPNESSFSGVNLWLLFLTKHWL